MANITGRAFVTSLQIRQRAAFNVALSDGTQVTINDDDNVQGSDPGTGRSVDAGGCGWTDFAEDGSRTEGRNGLLAYANNFPYTDLAFEIPGRLKLIQNGAARLDGGFYELRFTGTRI